MIAALAAVVDRHAFRHAHAGCYGWTYLSARRATCGRCGWGLGLELHGDHARGERLGLAVLAAVAESLRAVVYTLHVELATALLGWLE